MKMTATLDAEVLGAILNFAPPLRSLDGSERSAYLAACSALYSVSEAPLKIRPLANFNDDTGCMLNKVPCIKVMRAIAGFGLREAKDFVEEGRWLEIKRCDLERFRTLALAERVQLQTTDEIAA